jgi:hypothetical protein
LYQNKANQNLLKIKPKAKNKRKQINLGFCYTLKIKTKTKSIHLLCTYILKDQNPKQKIITQSILLLHLEIAVEFLPIRKTVKQNLISLSIFQNPKTPKQNKKNNPQPSMLYNSFIIIIIITIIK